MGLGRFKSMKPLGTSGEQIGRVIREEVTWPPLILHISGSQVGL